jgi:hypothetical protein
MTLAVYGGLTEKGLIRLLPEEVNEYFETLHRLNEARNAHIIEHAVELVALLNEIGVEPILLKGAANVMSQLYSDAAVRYMSDIDVVVPEDRATDCWRLLSSKGYRAVVETAREHVPTLACEWPPLSREGRMAEVELHRVSEWDGILGSAPLYANTEPLTAGSGRARILHPTARLIFTIAHAYVHHREQSGVRIPLRDLYDGSLLERQFAAEIDWLGVAATFRWAGHTKALSKYCITMSRLFRQSWPEGLNVPRWQNLYWQRCLLLTGMPRATDSCQKLVHSARLACSATESGERWRSEFFTRRGLVRKTRTAIGLVRATTVREERLP